jgi:perosamine synthetase
MRLGQRLTELLAPTPQVQPAAVTPGSEHTYWAYPLRTGRLDGVRFGTALQAEGIPNMPGYIGRPIYLCTEALTQRRTYGRSGFPFGSTYVDRDYEYVEGLCPRADAGLRHMVTLPINENYTDEDLADIAAAVAKVARGMAA